MQLKQDSCVEVCGNFENRCEMNLKSVGICLSWMFVAFTLCSLQFYELSRLADRATMAELEGQTPSPGQDMKGSKNETFMAGNGWGKYWGVSGHWVRGDGGRAGRL
jgi:hypothetical protein